MRTEYQIYDKSGVYKKILWLDLVLRIQIENLATLSRLRRLRLEEGVA